MKKLISIAALLFCMAAAHSQTSLNFCTGVDPNGFCVFNNTKYITSPDSTNGKIFIEVAGNGTNINTTKIVMMVYSVNAMGKEKLDTTLEQPIQSDWMYAWRPYVFKSPGKYDVKVFNDTGQMICSKALEMLPWK